MLLWGKRRVDRDGVRVKKMRKALPPTGQFIELERKRDGEEE